MRRHELEKLMGHASQGTTGIYTHLFRESYDTAHAALDAVYGRLDACLRLVIPRSATELRAGSAARF